ncbi:MAG: hypothetical protein CMP95_07050 [Gammaproteobacteria bacterium]|nr:hypothetical protein [Gammaproteobacteria bacterium]OUV68030.1 MAG: hypothetical protein CBC93_03395 [Gammaproteobacteria bacterium TMED133]
MNISNCPDQSWLVSYSGGGIPPSVKLILQAHMAVCPKCRSALKLADHLGGQFMFESDGEATEGFVAPHPEVGFKPEESVEWRKEERVDLTQVFNKYVGNHIDGFQWRRAGKGLKVCKLSEEDGYRLLMLRAEPGTVLPEHRHEGSELTLILKGSYFCEDTIFRAGDVDDADNSSPHQPIVTNDSECVCISAIDGPLKLAGPLQRMMQPFLGI